MVILEPICIITTSFSMQAQMEINLFKSSREFLNFTLIH